MDKKDDFHGSHAVSDAYPMDTYGSSNTYGGGTDTYGDNNSYDFEKQEPYPATAGLNQAHGTFAPIAEMNEHGSILGGTKRKLKQRHMAMIALGGTIGTGIFVGIGNSLYSAGPVSTWIAYCIMASLVYSMTVALGEMATLFPVAGGFTHYASRFCDEALGFAVGFNYAYAWSINLPTEIVAAAMIIEFWDAKTHIAVYITVAMVTIWIINYFGARAYGEAEFWFSSIKVIAIVGLIILAFILMCGGGPNRDTIGFRYWREAPFKNIKVGKGDAEHAIPGSWGKFLAFFAGFIGVGYSFLGTEVIGVTVGEAENPRKTVPKAIRRVFWRIICFYILGVFFVSNVVSSNDPNLLGSGTDVSTSPWVIAIKNAGIKGLPSLINAVILISAWSAGISCIYGASRTLYALSLEGKMPRFMRYCTRHGLPIWCVTITSAFGLLSYLGMKGQKDQDSSLGQAWTWLQKLSAVTGLITWWSILFSYLRFYYGLKKQNISRANFPYRAPFQPYLSWYGIIGFSIIIVLSSFTVFLKGNWNPSVFAYSYISIPIFAIAFTGWKLTKRTRWVPLSEIDFVTGRRELDVMEDLDQKKFNKETSLPAKIASILF